jgi:CubicO group peptidase (beta-lactamase class C family)
MSNSTVLRLASCTKILTAVCALRLVQSASLALDDPAIIENHLPELCSQPVITSSPGQPFTFEPRKNAITLRKLLTHTSGVGADLLDPRLQAWRKERGEKQLTLVGPVAEAFGVPLLFQPGEGWSYGGGLDFVGLLIERSAGKSFGEVLRREVFDVVGCDAHIGFWENQLQDTSIAQVVTRKGNKLKDWPIRRAKHEMGGGGALSSAENMVRVLQDLVSDTPKLLDKDLLAQLFAPQFEEGSPSLEALRASSPVFVSMTGPLTGSLDKEAINHGLGGLLIMKDNEGLGKTAGTMAWGGAFGSMWFANREQGLAGFFGTSMFPPFSKETGEMVGLFFDEVWRKAAEKA